MIASLIALLGSSAVGSLIGGVFAFLNRKTDIEVKRIELAHEVDKWSHDLKVRESDLAIAKEEAKSKLDVAVGFLAVANIVELGGDIFDGTYVIRGYILKVGI